MENVSIKDIVLNKLIHPVFQPIVDLTEPAIIGYEALIRGPANTNMVSPRALFEAAREAGLTVRLEYLCIEVACRQFFSTKNDGKLFINVSPISLVNPHTDQHIVEMFENELVVDKERIVIELSESYPIDDYRFISEALHYLRGKGFELAIDDLGAGYSSLRVWSEFKPEYVKIDRHFIDGIDKNPVNHEFVRSMQDISRSVGSHVIAEGIETEAELKVISSLGISHGQGFLLGKPNQELDCHLSIELSKIINPLKHFVFYRHTDTIANLMEYSDTIQLTDKLAKCAELVEDRNDIHALPVLNGNKPVGIITRQKILEIFFGRYGRELYSRRPVSSFIDDKVLIVEQSTSLSEVSRAFTANKYLDMNSNIVIIHNGVYTGIVRPKKLLEKITQRQIMSARYSNPLTMLPGNVPIYEWIDELLEKQENFKLAYFDLNNFKPYNDIYGYSRGDKVITLLANVLKENVDLDKDRLGHIGGDDFVIVYTSEDWQQRCENVLNQFREKVKAFYSDEDLSNNGIYSEDRRGEKQFFAILSIAIGVVDPNPILCNSHHDVAVLATDAKHQAKKMGGNALYVSRRRGNDRSHLSRDENIKTDDEIETSDDQISFLEDYGT